MRNAKPISGRIIVKVPASTANLGPGFDSLGMALSLFAWISMEPSETTRITLVGDNLEGVSQDKTNLVYVVAQSVFDKAGIELPELDIGIRSDIPLTRGLGSSASAIVGALVAANSLIGNVLTDDELFQMATALEKHPDNVGASLFGGIIAAAWDGTRAEYVRIEPPSGMDVLVAIPEFELSTKKARNVLPEQITLSDAVFNVTHSSLLTAALASGRLDLLSHAMRDRLHQPYRAALIPGMDRILREATDHGALGAVLSGAGPTLLFLARSEHSRNGQLVAFIQEVMAGEGITVKTQWLDPCLHGPQVLFMDENHPDYDKDPHRLLRNVKVEVGA
ncbi:homoserine kinase [Cohnella silvisoli]|uniref:Homoserine kinase n=1 Tax=Cohnella silvisoli TaxID=2873699 RepID=A0ABV1KVA6_9BACL|nr:homoserine kinase [Cohnella silvisoli]MCD9022690.1 homoserine kinase [Cohnella silvisoli]